MLRNETEKHEFKKREKKKQANPTNILNLN
jgi:hypothetical protein